MFHQKKQKNLICCSFQEGMCDRGDGCSREHVCICCSTAGKPYNSCLCLQSRLANLVWAAAQPRPANDSVIQRNVSSDASAVGGAGAVDGRRVRQQSCCIWKVTSRKRPSGRVRCLSGCGSGDDWDDGIGVATGAQLGGTLAYRSSPHPAAVSFTCPSQAHSTSHSPASQRLSWLTPRS